jgi:hypothetical protein
MAIRLGRFRKRNDGAASGDEIPGIRILTPEEGSALFDREARETLGISGEEFLRRWDAGEYRPIPDTPEGWKIGRLVMMIPFARRTKA